MHFLIILQQNILCRSEYTIVMETRRQKLRKDHEDFYCGNFSYFLKLIYKKDTHFFPTKISIFILKCLLYFLNAFIFKKNPTIMFVSVRKSIYANRNLSKIYAMIVLNSFGNYIKH